MDNRYQRLLVAAIVLSGAAAGLAKPALAQTFTQFPIPTANSSPYGITKGPDGNLWFTECVFVDSACSVSKIGRITPAGVLTEFPIPTANGNPYGITAGPDGALWFTEHDGNKIGRIPTTATIANPQITEYQLPTTGCPISITAGPDGNLWFTEESGDKAV